MPPAIYGPIHPLLYAAFVDALVPTAGLPEGVLAGHVLRGWGMNRVKRWLGCAPIHDRFANSWPYESLIEIARGFRSA